MNRNICYKVGLIICLNYQFLTTYSKLQNINFQQNNISLCLVNIYKKNPDTNTMIVSYNQKSLYDFNYSIKNNNLGFLIYTKNKFDFLNSLQTFQMFIIFVNTVKQFEDTLVSLSQSKLWNSRGKFLVGYFGIDDIGQIFNISWTYYVFNINVIAINETSANVATYFPYKNGNCGQYKTHELLFSCDDQSVENFFPKKIPLDLQGCEVSQVVINNYSYI